MSAKGIEEKRPVLKAYPDEYTIIRLDGRGFSNLTKRCKKPFDDQFTNAMIEAARALAHELSALCVYTQSDEITVVLSPDDNIIFGGRYEKLLSISASIATAVFIRKMTSNVAFEGTSLCAGHFDARLWNVQCEMDVVDAIMARASDCYVNAVGMIAHNSFTHNELLNKTVADRLSMLKVRRNIAVHKFPYANMYGTIVKREQYEVNVSEITDVDIRMHMERQNIATFTRRRFVSTSPDTNKTRDVEYWKGVIFD